MARAPFSRTTFANTFLILLFLVAAAFAGNKDQSASKTVSLTGVVSDTMCRGARHDPAHTAADCARHCVERGSKFALVSDGKVYTLAGHEGDLQKLAGEQVTVEGTVSGYDVTVTSAGPANRQSASKE
jgi:Protein of unknown function (DUF5818)